MLLNQHVKTEVTQVRGIDSNIQKRLGFPSTLDTERKARVLRGMSRHLCGLWQSGLRIAVPRIDGACTLEESLNKQVGNMFQPGDTWLSSLVAQEPRVDTWTEEPGQLGGATCVPSGMESHFPELF